MLKQLQISIATLALLGLVPGSIPLVAAPEAAPAPTAGEPQAPVLSAEELDKLLAPIALYPDPLLAQILPAATDPGDVPIAARYVAAKKDPEKIDEQPWEESVRALARYPDVLKMMDEKLDWTTELGEVFIAQPQDVFDSVQRLRAKAHELGNLKDSPQQKIVTEKETVQDTTHTETVVEKEVIKIVPADPTVVYVPQYPPETVYVQESVDPLVPLVTFGAGLLMGAWIHNEVMWNNGSVYCHNGGWNTNGGSYNGGGNNINIDNSNNINGGNRPGNGGGGSTWKPGSKPKASQLPTYSKDGIGNRNGVGGNNGVGDRTGVGGNNGVGDRNGIGGNNGPGDRNGVGGNNGPGDRNGIGGNNKPGNGNGVGGNNRPSAKPSTKPTARPSTGPSQGGRSQASREGTKPRPSDMGNRSGGSRSQPSGNRGGGGARGGGGGGGGRGGGGGGGGRGR